MIVCERPIMPKLPLKRVPFTLQTEGEVIDFYGRCAMQGEMSQETLRDIGKNCRAQIHLLRFRGPGI